MSHVLNAQPQGNRGDLCDLLSPESDHEDLDHVEQDVLLSASIAHVGLGYDDALASISFSHMRIFLRSKRDKQWSSRAFPPLSAARGSRLLKGAASLNKRAAAPVELTFNFINVPNLSAQR